MKEVVDRYFDRKAEKLMRKVIKLYKKSGKENWILDNYIRENGL